MNVSTSNPQPAPGSTRTSLSAARSRRTVAGFQQLTDSLFRYWCQAGALLVIVLAALLVLVLLWQAWLAIQTLGLEFFETTTWDPEPSHRVFGALAFIYGTVVTSLIAMVIAVPLGVGTAAFLSEIATPRLQRIGSFLVEMLAAIPSVVYGFWGLFVLAPTLQSLITELGGPNQGGVGILPAGIILAIMIVPYVSAVSFDVCQAVPRSQREASFALGATRWQTIWSVVLPYARPGIIGGCFLALGRALGETMAVTMLIGNKTIIDLSPFAMGNSIPSVIANEFTEATYDLYLSALVELGLVLMLVTVLLNALARVFIWRIGRTRKTAGASERAGWWPVVTELAGRMVPAFGVLAFLAWLFSPLLVAQWHSWQTTEPAVRIGMLVLLLVGSLACLMAIPYLLARIPWHAPWFSRLMNGMLILAVGATLLACVGIGLRASLGASWLAVPGTRELWTVGIVGCLLTLGYGIWRCSFKVEGINVLMTGVLGLCLVVTAGCLLLIFGYLLYEGFTSLNWDFFTKLPAPVGEKGGGMANAIVGSFTLVGLATLFAVPIGLFAAIYLAEYRSERLGPVVRFIGEMLGGVPSIVIGIFGYYLVVKPLGHFSGWAGAFALGVMMIPIVMRASEEALRLVPQSIRHASFALGASHAQTITRVTVLAALPAIITAIFLGIARVIGETAPLLLTAFNNSHWPSSPNDATPSLPYYIYSYAISPYDDWHRQGWAAALVLLMIVMLLSFGVRLITGRRGVLASRAD